MGSSSRIIIPRAVSTTIGGSSIAGPVGLPGSLFSLVTPGLKDGVRRNQMEIIVKPVLIFMEKHIAYGGYIY